DPSGGHGGVYRDARGDRAPTRAEQDRPPEDGLQGPGREEPGTEVAQLDVVRRRRRGGGGRGRGEGGPPPHGRGRRVGRAQGLRVTVDGPDGRGTATGQDRQRDE